MSLSVWVTPGARRSELSGVVDGRLRIRLAAPPVEGRANDALVRYVAGLLGLRREEVTVVAGARSRRKLLHLSGVTLLEARDRLGL
ncbi:MAG TPA: DUF167 domain-containing protein [Thermoleophilia bacterium]|nr:DUF167 domain-containing protein [Thermoleophilia bacterium]